MTISFSDFAKLELCIGKIIEVDDHPNADKLFVLKVDVGNEIRTLVAGIKQNYSKEELMGKYVVVLVNLEPKKLRGIESEGMLLAADDGKEVSLLTIDKEIKIGAKVR
jgi:methionyl-tRNA synthetase